MELYRLTIYLGAKIRIIPHFYTICLNKVPHFDKKITFP